MIQYSLKCEQGHRFDSWFQSAAAYDKLSAAGHVGCAVCGSTDVTKAVMAPRVNHSSEVPAKPRPLSEPASEVEAAISKLRDHVEKTSDYVGKDFAREARAMHEGETPQRAIHGEAKGEEAKKLIEDGIPVLPLPFSPTRKTN